MSSSLSRRFSLLALPILSACGLQVSDTRIRTAADVGVPDNQALVISEERFVCPNTVAPALQGKFETAKVRSGQVEGVFGPMAPCETILEQQSGVCGGCGNPYHLPGAQPVFTCSNMSIISGTSAVQCNSLLPGFQEGGQHTCNKCNLPVGGNRPPRKSVEAMPLLSCPYGDCGKPLSPGSLLRRDHQVEKCNLKNHRGVGPDHGSPDSFEPAQCPHCKRYFESQPSDLTVVLGVLEEVVCASCNQPVDPSLNVCTNSRCKLVLQGNGTIRNVEEFEGPCWRCAGTDYCTECDGSGSGEAETFADCWSCLGTGKCKECGYDGFTTYEGSLPAKFRSWGKQGQDVVPLPSEQRKWRHDAPAQPAASE